MRGAVTGLFLACAIAGCAAPAPGPTGSITTRSLDPSPPTHGALREPAATAVAAAPEQLVLVEDGFVAARFRNDTQLELVWIGPVDGTLVSRVLVTVEERRSEGDESFGSVHAAVCPVGLGLARTRYLFGQETAAAVVHLDGLVAEGGTVAGGTYVFAIGDEVLDPSTHWTITDDAGRELASGDASWLAPSSGTAADGVCTVTSEH